MELLLRNGHVFAPQYAGVNDILIEKGVITCIRPGISVSAFACARELDVSGMYVTPGFIDSHVHIIGGGGETGESSLIPPLHASDLYANGITGCIGMLGFEKRKKTPQMLYDKAREFAKKGIETYMLSGSYHMPPASIFKTIAEDLNNLALCMGAGEIALEDNRVEGFLMEQIILLLQTVHKASKKTQKPLKVVFHIGNTAKDLSLLFRMVKIYPSTLELAIPAHVNRSQKILEDACEYIRMGGTADVSAGIGSEDKESGFIPAAEALLFMLQKAGSLNRVTLSSDAGGSIPVYDENKHVISSHSAPASALAADLRSAYRQGMKLSELLKTVTVNPAVSYGFSQGQIFEGAKALLNITDDDLNIRHTILQEEVI